MKNNLFNFNPFNSIKKSNNSDKTKKRKSSTIKTEMYQKNIDVTGDSIKKMLYIVIAFLTIVVIFLVVAINTKKDCKYDSESFLTEMSTYRNNSLTLAKEVYYKVRDIYSDFALGTINICGPFLNDIKDSYYRKSGNVKFTTYNQLIEYVSNSFSDQLVKVLVSPSNYKEYDGNLYCAIASRNPDNYYKGVSTITLVSNSKTEMKFLVKEQYLARSESLDCTEDCKYEYKENIFTLTNYDGVWKVSEFTLPY